MNTLNSPSAVLAIDVNPFCQLVGRDIPATQCLEMQGQEGCFGCAAPTRLCENCKAVPVDVPAVGLCSKCLVHQLRKEEIDKFFEKQPESLVQCQIVKREIRVEMCLATQGQEGCKNCPAPSRLCEKCKERPCRIPQYGLCLHCSVEEFGEDWGFDEAAALPEAEPTRDKVARFVTSMDNARRLGLVQTVTVRVPRETGGQEPDQPTASQKEQLPMNKVSMDEVKDLVKDRDNIHVPTLRKQMPHLSIEEARGVLEQCEREEWVGPAVGQGGWRKVLIGKIGSSNRKREVPNQNQRMAEQISKYMPKMRKILANRRVVSRSFVCRKFMISKVKARLILDHCEKEGLVGPARMNAARAVLTQAQRRQTKKESSSASEILPLESQALARVNNPTTPQKIAKLNKLINLFGEGELSKVLQSIIVDLQTLRAVNQMIRHAHNETKIKE